MLNDKRWSGYMRMEEIKIRMKTMERNVRSWIRLSNGGRRMRSFARVAVSGSRSSRLTMKKRRGNPHFSPCYAIMWSVPLWLCQENWLKRTDCVSFAKKTGSGFTLMAWNHLGALIIRLCTFCNHLYQVLSKSPFKHCRSRPRHHSAFVLICEKNVILSCYFLFSLSDF